MKLLLVLSFVASVSTLSMKRVQPNTSSAPRKVVPFETNGMQFHLTLLGDEFGTHVTSTNCADGLTYDNAPGCGGCYADAIIDVAPGSALKVLSYPWENQFQTVRYLKCAFPGGPHGTCRGSRSGWFTGRKKCWDRTSTHQVQMYRGQTITSPSDLVSMMMSGGMTTVNVDFPTRCECY